MNHKNIHGSYIEESEIKLKEVISIILKYKKFIILFVFIITSLTTINVLFKPNKYRVYTVLVPQGVSKNRRSPFASIIGINSGGGVTPDVDFKVLLKNYIFMKDFILKKEIDKKILSNDLKKDYVYIINNNIYNFFKSSKKSNNKKTDQKKKKIDFFSSLYKPLANGFSISTNEETGIITVSFTHPSRHFAYYVLTSFLEYGSKYLANKDMQEINTQIKKYQNELKKTNNIEIKSELARLISSLIKRKVYINSSKYYKVKVLSEPYIPDIKDKIGPKRKHIILIAFIGSFIVAIFLVFFVEFIKYENEKHHK